MTGNAGIQLRLVMYLIVCGVETYILKYCVVPYSIVSMLSDQGERMGVLGWILPTSNEISDKASLWATPIDMDQKLNKVTYQKARLATTVLFVGILFLYDTTSFLCFGPSDFELTLKKDKSLLIYFMLAAIIVWRQKYEVQILTKYRQDNLQFGKAFYLPTVFLCSSFSYMIIYYGKDGQGMIIVHFVFMLAYLNFFWNKACRQLGLNQLL